ncbi:MAG: substrate-binding periplasmic protein [Gulosibacter sp.]|uniref:substrate-binding periplasmic protein n=1 Tax=Gulosibacter sp. TaxID=2817531 RepID=UPI003F919827
MVNKKIAAAVGVAAVLMLSGCTQASDVEAASPDADCVPEWEFPTVTDGILTVAVVGSLPYTDMEPGGTTSTGIEGDFYTEFAERACLVPQFESYGGAAIIAAMTEENADVAAGGWVITPERDEVIGQTEPVWFEYNAIASNSGASSITDLQGQATGILAGSIYEELLAEAIGQEFVKTYQTNDAIFQDLAAGRIDAAVGASGELNYQRSVRSNAEFEVNLLNAFDENYPELTSSAGINFPHTKGNDELTAALNAYVSDIRDNGTVEEVLKTYGLDDPAYVEEPAQP